MFFTPKMIELHREKQSTSLLCLSTGNFAGLGHIREKELTENCKAVGIPADRVHIVDDKRLQDGMQEVWEPTVIAQYLDKYVCDIDVLYTFDEWGISAHPNHIAVHNGVKSWYNNSRVGGLEVQYLETTNIFRKYIGFLDVPISLLLFSKGLELSLLKWPRDDMFAALKSMQRHKSQLVWFRYLFILFSRYAYINSFKAA
eukprot:TRINITY_DN61502_c0_g1_i4.p1 TRINITY_DN61502_c0_g1~~TRINITY_DN61502_c0_g1_i4.p1  ORF type:complete len:200 (-),score=2.77 TRINITY_DN61502_c0_g1_i4:101-700(-)